VCVIAILDRPNLHINSHRSILKYLIAPITENKSAFSLEIGFCNFVVIKLDYACTCGGQQETE